MVSRNGFRKTCTILETITPTRAKRYLNQKARNRPVSDTWVRRLAGAIKSGEWKVNGETIKFNDQGELEDGQHRLEAIVLSNTPVKTFVTHGLPSNNGIFETIDTGKRRTVGDMFARRGEANYTTLSGAVGWLWRFERGAIDKGRKDSPRHAEAMAVLEANPDIRRSVAVGCKARKILPPSMASCLHYLFAQKDHADADEFFYLLISGENLSKGSMRTSGIFLLRSRLEDNRVAKAKLPADEIFPLVIKAWNAFRTRTVLKTLRWRTNGDAESFPVIQ